MIKNLRKFDSTQKEHILLQKWMKTLLWTQLSSKNKTDCHDITEILLKYNANPNRYHIFACQFNDVFGCQFYNH